MSDREVWAAKLRSRAGGLSQASAPAPRSDGRSRRKAGADVVIKRAIDLGVPAASFTKGGVNHCVATFRGSFGPEAVEQAVVACVLRTDGILFHASPNGAQVTKVSAGELVALGMAPGVPDLLVFSPPVALEFKAPDKRPVRMAPLDIAAVSDAQRHWIGELRKAGWAAEVVFTAEEAIGLLVRLAALSARWAK